MKDYKEMLVPVEGFRWFTAKVFIQRSGGTSSTARYFIQAKHKEQALRAVNINVEEERGEKLFYTPHIKLREVAAPYRTAAYVKMIYVLALDGECFGVDASDVPVHRTVWIAAGAI